MSFKETFCVFGNLIVLLARIGCDFNAFDEICRPGMDHNDIDNFPVVEKQEGAMLVCGHYLCRVFVQPSRPMVTLHPFIEVNISVLNLSANFFISSGRVLRLRPMGTRGPNWERKSGSSTNSNASPLVAHNAQQISFEFNESFAASAMLRFTIMEDIDFWPVQNEPMVTEVHWELGGGAPVGFGASTP